MENKYSVEEIEFIYANECDCNAQVTRPVEIDETEEQTTTTAPTQSIINEPMEGITENTSAIRVIARQNAATNWLLVAILFMLFLFMIFKCD